MNYRLAPEHKFPAAVEDVAAVYKALLSQYEPENIGIYGCSAGGILTAQSVAWFDKHQLPMPGAIGTFCGSASPLGGDSSHLTLPLTGKNLHEYFPLADAKEPNRLLWSLPYFAGLDSGDPLVFAVNSPELLAKFPPTLLLTGSRDFMLSSLFNTQRQLTKAGVSTELHVWDGLGHFFFMDPDLPESSEVYEVVAKFFDTHLGQRRSVREAKKR